MATENRQLNIVLELKDRASKQLKGFQGRLEALQPTFQKMAVAGTAALAGIGFGVSKAVKEASRVQEIDRLFDATFNETESRMAKWSSEVAEKFGRAEQDIRQMAATAGSVLGPAFDIAESEIADMTTGMGEAAIALAATDVRIDNAQQAMEGFTQALTGNRQRVIDWGFQVRDAQLEARALEEGIIDVGESLTHQQKAMLTAKMITEQVSVSTRVLNESQQDWSQVSKRLKGQLKELSASIGSEFLPMIEKYGSKLVPVIKSIREWIQENPKLTKWIIIITALVAGLVAILGTLGIVIFTITPAITAIGTVIGLLSLPILLIIGLIGVIVATVIWWVKNWKQNMETIKFTFSSVKERIIAIWEQIKQAFKSAVDWIKSKTIDPLVESIEKIIDVARRARDAVANIGGKVKGGVSRAISSVGSFIGINDGVITPNGQVVKTAPEDFIMATKNPENLMGGNGMVINISGGIFGSDAPEELGNQIIEKLQLSSKF